MTSVGGKFSGMMGTQSKTTSLEVFVAAGRR